MTTAPFLVVLEDKFAQQFNEIPLVAAPPSVSTGELFRRRVTNSGAPGGSALTHLVNAS